MGYTLKLVDQEPFDLARRDPRRAFAGLVAFARGRGLALFDPQTDGFVDLDAPGELPGLFAGETDRVAPGRLVWASELARRVKREDERREPPAPSP